MSESAALTSLSTHEARTAAAVFDRMFPADADSPAATEIGAVSYLDRMLGGTDTHLREDYRFGLSALDRTARQRWGDGFADGGAADQDRLLAELERGEIPGWRIPDQTHFFTQLRFHLQEGLFADPIYGGNRDKQGWRFLGHPGVWLENSADEQLSESPVDKGGVIQSLVDLGYALGAETSAPVEIPGYDPQRGADPPAAHADILIVGAGGVGGFITPIFAKAGLKVVALEAGPWRTKQDFLPDELGAAYWCRGNMGPKFLEEAPRWRPDSNTPGQPITYSLGRMMNGVGGSIVHYGAWLRRFHPHHFHFRSYVEDRWRADAIPEDCTVADWPVTYDRLEPFFTRTERIVGIAGDDSNPFVPRSAPFPMPPHRPFRMGELFRAATEAMGLHPHPAQVGLNSVPYDGRPATTYTAWQSGFGPLNDEKWHPGHGLPSALATGNLDLRTHCRVTKVITDRDGRARGVEYINQLGERYRQDADIVILSAYTFENV
ncbi:MAG: gluconate 2-dehydrogenase subunit 3 family protein, partial [Chloroflexota bacterium]|nr:gluconate 2-dehydrogenase subunit 3 family protein [Chloroflexota bacterium]